MLNVVALAGAPDQRLGDVWRWPAAWTCPAWDFGCIRWDPFTSTTESPLPSRRPALARLRDNNRPKTVLEAVARHSPCLAVDFGSMPVLIKRMQTGYLAVLFAQAKLAAGLAWLLENADPAMWYRSRLRILVRHTLINQVKHDQTPNEKLIA